MINNYLKIKLFKHFNLNNNKLHYFNKLKIDYYHSN